MSDSPPSASLASFGLRELAMILFRHKKKVLSCSLGMLALGTLVLLFAPRKYRSEAQLFLQVGRESVRLDPTATTGAMIGLQQSGRDYEITSAIEVLKSREILKKTVERLTPEVVLGQVGDGAAPPNQLAEAVLAPLRFVVGAVKDLDPISPTEDAIITLERNLAVDAEHQSTVIVVAYDAESPKLAQQVLAELIDVYREEHLRLHRTTGSKDFFAEQRRRLQATVDSAVAAIRDAKNEMGVASIDSRRGTLENRLASIQLSRVEVDQQLISSQAEIDRLEDQIASMPEWLPASKSVGPNTGADTLRSQLYTLQVQLMNLEAKYNGDHPLVQSTRSQVEEATRLLKDERNERETTIDAVNPNRRELVLKLAQIESSKAGLDARKQEIQLQSAQVMAELQQLNDYELRLDTLGRDKQIAEANLLRYEQNFEQARIDEELDRQRITNINVAQDPTFAEKPVSPSKLIVGGLSLMLASVGALALGLGAEKLDTRIWSDEQVEKTLGLPLVAVVPEGRAYAGIPRRT